MPYKGKWNVTTSKGHPIADGLSKQIMKRERRRDERRVGREVVVKEWRAWERELYDLDNPPRGSLQAKLDNLYVYIPPDERENEMRVVEDSYDPYPWEDSYEDLVDARPGYCWICRGPCANDRDRA